MKGQAHFMSCQSGQTAYISIFTRHLQDLYNYIFDKYNIINLEDAIIILFFPLENLNVYSFPYI